jgi:aryl-alcohol dehydrogenase-like predicted oxidoreductase
LHDTVAHNPRKQPKRYLKIAEEHDMSLAQMALAFVNQCPFVTSNIIGATSIKQLEEEH